MVNLEPIPLVEEESTHQVVLPEKPGVQRMRGRRNAARHSCENVYVSFSPELSNGRIDHAECPVQDLSSTGMGIEYDAPLPEGLRAQVAYRTVGCQFVRIACRVMRCRELEPGRYLIGVVFARTVRGEELKPAHRRTGRRIGQGIRTRKLKFEPGLPAMS